MLLAEAVHLAGEDRHRRADALAGAAARRQFARQGRAAARDHAAAPQPAGARAGRPRGEARSQQAGRGRRGLAAQPRRRAGRPADRADGEQERARQLRPRLCRRAARPGAADHQPARLRVRRGELEEPHQPGGEHLRSPGPAAAGQPGAADPARGAAAGEEGGEHGSASRPDQRQHRDGERAAAVARLVLDAAAHRAGPAEPARVAARRDAPRHRHRAADLDRAVPAMQRRAGADQRRSSRSSRRHGRSATPTSIRRSIASRTRSRRRDTSSPR